MLGERVRRDRLEPLGQGTFGGSFHRALSASRSDHFHAGNVIRWKWASSSEWGQLTHGERSRALSGRLCDAPGWGEVDRDRSPLPNPVTEPLAGHVASSRSSDVAMVFANSASNSFTSCALIRGDRQPCSGLVESPQLPVDLDDQAVAGPPGCFGQPAQRERIRSPGLASQDPAEETGSSPAARSGWVPTTRMMRASRGSPGRRCPA
jgi:hypothetical protein